MRFKDLTLANIRNFIEGNIKSLQRTFLPHEKEQVIYRATACSDCLNAGKCRLCGCATPGLFYAPKKKDSAGKWGVFMDIVEWDKFKKTKEYEKIMGKTSKTPANLRAVYSTPPRPGTNVVSPSSGVYMEPTNHSSDSDSTSPVSSKDQTSNTDGVLPQSAN